MTVRLLQLHGNVFSRSSVRVDDAVMPLGPSTGISGFALWNWAIYFALNRLVLDSNELSCRLGILVGLKINDELLVYHER